MTAQLLAAAGVLAVLTVAPGPDVAVVTQRVLTAGRGDGLRAAGGIALGLLVWGVLTVCGLAAILAASATAYLVVKLAGAVYLLWLGVRALWHSRRATAHPSALPRRRPTANPWRAGLATDLLNPKIAVFYTGVLPALAPRHLPAAAGMAVLVALHVLLTVGWLGIYVHLLSRATTFFERPRVRLALDRATGLVLIGFGVTVAAGSS